MQPSGEATMLALRQRGDSLFRSPYNQRPVRVAAEHQARQPVAVEHLGTGERIEVTNAAFNVFNRAHEGTAVTLSRRLAAIARAEPDVTGLGKVLDEVEQELTTQNSDLVKFALSVFITNNPLGRELYIPPETEQSPDLFIPLGQVPDVTEPLGGLGAEAVLD